MTDFYDKPYHSKTDLVGDPNKQQEGSHKTGFAFVSHLGAGKHPSPLEKTKTNSPNHYLTVGFYRIKKY